MMLATRVLQRGEGDRPWLIWLHGLLGNNNEWRVIASRCPEWPSLAIDLPGHGDSVAVACSGFDDISAQISAALQLRNIERYWLVGYSLGGRIAMYHACYGQHEGLQGVIVEGGNPGLDNEALRGQRREQDAVWAERFRHQPIAEVLADWYRLPVFAELSQVHRQALIAARADNSGPAVADMLEATSLGRQPYLAPQLRQLAVPLLVLCGANDPKFQRLARDAGLRLRIVPQAGHNAHLANPQAFVAELQNFLVNPG
ncbi:2-succinyl-6-hydroxy-2,4-cyclohexadiene-1-carboxylate synthase [Serratia entomophila]|jgi:2-succinyl-6-hydroxy-2,4-cyclohexadiene-1-carboxylate synthase|uniref:2-succinyl-6-hydroxy-2, 4-cyclohexadiene-1-carboxylate synthase n=1 Tax=Serratia entomophila TaxID=42906 RepID=UPI002179CEDE|nr:2-succinyl-6-hydroxy-2,4-cyclohexadiene-1-carboxylate synthase [Serratia entomophila]CAI1128161.1 2-succinyl-6-hydroxy-2,4-cyclohexadiene-1-carboxylate synthase [Serratia entomophila]CAI1856184.1 2-succinyl-6-hydroxy-2,4-cyclohexadiene-1-carboxylate synthase [Serratia entomophila]CAI1860627.1 2-succinyl-6-hydroxy-2,4-cyclohexadiene-1-carboxylate synthase [Serratia entomophila]CAI1918031.1 2-succinyl-6-hydroxy-2,4-cyclohexadiene-1-carboxylate synthase [Serratia entomophila]CAI1948717.1 2-suc